MKPTNTICCSETHEHPKLDPNPFGSNACGIWILQSKIGITKPALTETIACGLKVYEGKRPV